MRIHEGDIKPIPLRLIVAFRVHGDRSGLAFTSGLVFTSKTEAARVLCMTGSQVNDVVTGRRRHAKGWVFETAWTHRRREK